VLKPGAAALLNPQLQRRNLGQGVMSRG